MRDEPRSTDRNLGSMVLSDADRVALQTCRFPKHQVLSVFALPVHELGSESVRSGAQDLPPQGIEKD
jgi:hypothetical protein